MALNGRMTGERNGNSGLMKVLFHHLPGRTEKNQVNLRIGDASTEIRTGNLLNESTAISSTRRLYE